MNKKWIPKSIFKNFILDEFIKKFQDNIKNLNSQMNNTFINQLTSNLQDFTSNLQDSQFLKDMILYLNSPVHIFNNNGIGASKYCSNCDKEFWLNNLKVTTYFFNNSFLCNCNKPNILFNKSIFYTNLNFLIFNYIYSIFTWNQKMQEIKLLTQMHDIGKNFYLKSKLNYELKALLEDTYAKIDTIKFNIYMMSKNEFSDELLITNSFFRKNKKEIKDIQNPNKKFFFDTLKELLNKLNIKNDLGIFKKFNLISNHNKISEVNWIIGERNNLVHNFATIACGNYISSNNLLEKKRLNIIILLVIDNILFLYSLLEIFNCLE